MKLFNVRKLFIISGVLIFFAVNPLFAQRSMTIRLASLVPENTAWGQSINRLAAEWNRVTNGYLNVIVLHGGTAGDEAKVMGLLRSNQVQAAVLTSIGLNSVAPELFAISYPFLIRNDAELDEVLKKIKPDLDARMHNSGFVSMALARAGWVKIFSKTPVVTPDDLRRIKFGTPSAEQDMMQAFRTLGYNVVPANLTETLFSFQSGRIDATYLSPVYAAAQQIFGIAGNMTSVNVAPFMGGILMNEVTWRRIPENYRSSILEASKRMEKDIEASIANLETEAITTMLKYGLKVNELSMQQNQMWYDDTARYESRLVGSLFNREYYGKINNILSEYRRGR
jgi:TRAP-type C4-dicarboxylate transport system substrate-binding protein